MIGWYEAAATGLAWAMPPANRVRPVAALAVWLALNADLPKLLQPAIEVAERVMRTTAPGARVLDTVVVIMAEHLAQVTTPDQVAKRMVEFLAPLDQSRREQAMRAFLAAPQSRV